MANPVLNERVLQQERILDGEPMTINGAINKTFLLLAILFIGSVTTWNYFFQGAMDKVMALTTFGLIASIVAFIIIMFNRKAVKYMAPVYSVSEGFMLGGVSAMFEQSYPGIAIQAIALTMLCLLSMLILYRVGFIRCTEKFMAVISIATFSICGIYLINLIGSFFHLQIPYLFTSSTIGIGFSLFVVGVAALNLIIDFNFIEKGAQALLPKDTEWYGAFGLMVTLVWLYIEILHLLAKLRDRQ